MIGVAKIGTRARRGGGGAPSVNPDFVSTWDTTQAGSASDTVVLPLLSGGTYSGTIDWGDGNSDALSYANRTHVYASGGTYTITISGSDIQGWQFNNGGDKAKITDVSNWGNLTITTNKSFFGCSNLLVTATDAPTISTTNLEKTFNGTDLTNADLSAWDVSSVTNFVACFQLADFEGGNVSTWDVSSGTNFDSCFAVSNFDGDVSGWNLASATKVSWMFFTTPNFNSDITITSATTNVFAMFQRAIMFDQDISNWSVTQITGFGNFMAGGGIGPATLSTSNYDALLIAWDAQGAMSYSGTVNFGGSRYTSGGAAEAARTSLISKWGGITDGGAA
jgi:hypothetical protein